MAKDLVYYFDNDFVRHELGEIQSDFNQSFVIDGTKDSCKVEVYSFDDNEIMPWTIVWHKATNTWWVVSHDKVERYNNENGTFLYKHYLQLLGAIELLNARDLTDCGFNAKKYTFREFFTRLISLSTFEFKGNGQWGFTPQSFYYNISEHTLVDYIKTFQNYTLLSAIREFCDGYNIAPKLIFTQEQDGDDYILDQALFDLVPKTGLPNVTPINMSYFTDSRETRTIDKNSYGTSIVSNAENVQSTAMKEYPVLGGVKLSSKTGTVDYDNAILRLPSKIAKIEWVKIYAPLTVVLSYSINSEQAQLPSFEITGASDEANFDNFDRCARIACSAFYGAAVNPTTTEIYQMMVNDYKRFINQWKLLSTITLGTGWRYNPYDPNLFQAPANQPDFYFPYIVTRPRIGANARYSGALVISDEETRNTLKNPEGSLFWNRGGNTISGFELFQTPGKDQTCVINSYASTDFRDNSYDNGYTFISHSYEMYEGRIAHWNFSINGIDTYHLYTHTLRFKVKYVPMSDVKIKLDNSSTSKDIQFYNQNGRLTDGNALSKQLLSYAKTVESDNITRFKTFYDITTIPQVGQIVVDNDKRYVISNISKNFMECESSVENGVSYFCQCEFTMSLETGVKSLMVNPNTNIRDYGIPQQYNVERKQLYRDFYELDFTVNEDSTNNWYMSLQKNLNLTFAPNTKNYHTAIMKITWHDGSTEKTYYYQLEAIQLMLKKNYIEIVNFNDNNIIGYDSQNVASGFDITRILTGMTDTVNTPISYVKDDGTFESISIAFCDAQKTIELYSTYLQAMNTLHGTNYNRPLYNYCVFTSSDVYNGGYQIIEYISYGVRRRYEDYRLYNENNWTFRLYLKANGLIPQDYDGSASDLRADIIYQSYQGMSYENMYKDGNEYVFEIVFQQILTERYLDIELEISHKTTTDGEGAIDICDFLIEEPNYNKDALEVPVFEYSCQIDDTNNVKIGENVMLNQEEDIMYIYSYDFVNKNIATELNFINYVQDAINKPEGYQYSNDGTQIVQGHKVAGFEYRNGKLYISLANANEVNFLTKEQLEYGTHQTFDTTKDLVIYRYAIKSIPWANDTWVAIEDYQCDLMFIIRNLDQANIVTTNGYEELELAINYYKVD